MKNQYNSTELESTARRIIGYYIDSQHLEDDEVAVLLMYLNGGKIPSDTAEILRPILCHLIDNQATSECNLSKHQVASLERLGDDVEILYKERNATQKAIKSAINTAPWAKSEQLIADHFGLDLLSASDRCLDLMAHEVALSDFTAQDIITSYHSETVTIVEFCGRWYADANKRDYGEEWDPDEGNQQEGRPPGKLLGIGQGFMVTFIIFYLYASRAPNDLVAYYKRRKMAHGKKVAIDVLRVYQQTISKKS